ncbi:SMI1/KNR4 family protein [Nostoc sp. C052]|uniref:SMI1/KNR4 family protein n=1 Tax=Nostoc sp. C052 TaxID=2576902 RepID=UPI0015C2CFED|nr:SMI1/KNR4 family protein [Nostoc sp. C052]QLE44261.1 SMI1/KNR4 family protein [Nostoc sp. C052]
MSQLTDALDIILNWLQQNKPSYAYSLQPGLAYEEIEEKVKNLPFRLPKEVYELYQWRNGMCILKGEKIAQFFHGYTFLSLEDAIDEYNQLIGLWDDPELDYEWDKDLYEELAEMVDMTNGLIIPELNKEENELQVEIVNADIWKSDWFPIFYHDPQLYIIVACKHEYFAFISEIYLQSIEDGEPKIIFDSLTNMMLNISESYDKRV